MRGSDLIVDAHHHIWKQADLPWLQGATVPRIFGTYDAIKRDYSIGEFLADAMPHGVARSVYFQVNWDPSRAVEEVAWVQEVADGSGWPHAISSFVDLCSDEAPLVLAAQARFPLVRGVRQQLHWHENPLYRFAAAPDLMESARFRASLARLQDHGWLFELQIFPAQMMAGARLARAFPNIPFVLQHAGMLEDTTPAGWSLWRDGMHRLAQEQNMHVKLSGLGTFLRRSDPAHIAAVIRETLAIFGPGRCLWGSNFPIEKIWTDYGAIAAATNAALSDLAHEDRGSILFGNAARLCSLS